MKTYMYLSVLKNLSLGFAVHLHVSTFKILLLDNSTSMNLMTRLHIEHDMEHVYKTVNRGIYLHKII